MSADEPQDSAIHRGNIYGQQWFQDAVYVPVVEVATVPFQGFHGLKGIFGSLHELAHTNVAEVPRRTNSRAMQAHVCRDVRCATTENWIFPDSYRR